LYFGSNNQEWSYPHRQATLQVSSLWSPICASKGDATDSPIDSQLDQHTAAFRGCRSALFMRVTGVSERWLQSSVNQKYYLTPEQVEVSQKKLES